MIRIAGLLTAPSRTYVSTFCSSPCAAQTWRRKSAGSKPCCWKNRRSPPQPYIKSGGSSPRSFASALAMSRGSQPIPSRSASFDGRSSVATRRFGGHAVLHREQVIAPGRADEQDRLPIRLAAARVILREIIDLLRGLADRRQICLLFLGEKALSIPFPGAVTFAGQDEELLELMIPTGAQVIRVDRRHGRSLEPSRASRQKACSAAG